MPYRATQPVASNRLADILRGCDPLLSCSRLFSMRIAAVGLPCRRGSGIRGTLRCPFNPLTSLCSTPAPVRCVTPRLAISRIRRGRTRGFRRRVGCRNRGGFARSRQSHSLPRRRADGTLALGAAGFGHLRLALPGWRWIGRIVLLPGILQAVELVYRGFLIVRPCNRSGEQDRAADRAVTSGPALVAAIDQGRFRPYGRLPFETLASI